MRSKKGYSSLLVILILILSLVSATLFPYGNVFANTSNEGLNMPTLKDIKPSKTSIPFPKMSNIPVELELKRSALHREFLNPDGTFSAEIYSQPINWENKHGQWVPIDNNIVLSIDNPNFPLKNSSNNMDA
jgi:hypothetical protein